MCGIAGVVAFGRFLTDVDTGQARVMASKLRHRGPEGQGLLGDRDCVLANTRLRITDPQSLADLPMANSDDTIRIAYNGAVTNFNELQSKFKLDRNRPLRTNSDTEVVLRLYEDLGLDFLKELNGHFAFCLHDRRAKKVFLVRDFYGVRPLFYATLNQRIYFASELKSFLRIDGFPRRPNLEALHHYFSLAYTPGTLTAFEGITELDGGSLLEIDLPSSISNVRQYFPLLYRNDASLDRRAAASGVQKELRGALHRSMKCDASVGLTLSGGLDTSSLLALAKDSGTSSGLHTYSIKIDEPSYDESRFQRIMVEFAKPIHHEIVIRPKDVLDHLEVSVAYMDEPSGDGAAIPLFLLAKEARKNVKVLLLGEGGDEIFNAYETHRAYGIRKLYRKFPAFLRAGISSMAERLPVSYQKLSFDFLAKRFTRGSEDDVVGAHLFWRHVLSEADKRQLMPALPHYAPTDDYFRHAFHQLDFEDELDRLAWLDLKYYFIGDLMVKNDRMLMAHSVEARLPYMDRDLVDLATSIPSGWKVSRFGGRIIQKEAMAGLLPQAILNRANMGLEMPHSLWFLGDLRGLRTRYFTRRRIERCGILNFDAVERLWDDHLAGRRDNGRALWCVLNFVIWFELFVDSSDFERYLS